MFLPSLKKILTRSEVFWTISKYLNTAEKCTPLLYIMNNAAKVLVSLKTNEMGSNFYNSPNVRFSSFLFWRSETSSSLCKLFTLNITLFIIYHFLSILLFSCLFIHISTSLFIWVTWVFAKGRLANNRF